MPKLILVEGDCNYLLEFEIRDADGELVDLTNCTSATLRFQQYGSSSLTFEKGEYTIISTLSVIQFEITNELIDKSGEFIGEIEIHWGDKILTAPNLYIHIIKQLPK